VEYPLDGIRVLDFSRVLAGPFAGRMLSDLGADVLKVEPPEGDVTRFFGLRNGEMSGYYIQQNVGKRNICVDMKADGATDLIYKLVEKADVVIENFRPGVMDRFSIGWNDLSKINPKLVMLSISGFGQVGPERDRAAYAPILHAETGLLSRHAEITGQPAADFSLSVADTNSSLHGLVGILSALILVKRTGEGQHIDIGMIDAVHGTDDYANYIIDGAWPRAAGGQIWEGPDGKKVMISADLKFLWHIFSTKGGIVDTTPKDADLKTKIASRRQILTDKIKSYPTWDALIAQLDELNVAWGAVREFGDDAYSSPSIEARGILVEVNDGIGGKRRTIQSPYKFSNAKSGITTDSTAPRRGGHNLTALQEWIGLSEAQVEGLSDIGVLQADDGSKDGQIKAG
jgi:crotonobetainyl-CoA:carnitine CoA-transferase CaiB-like acyl-CoA transferase